MDQKSPYLLCSRDSIDQYELESRGIGPKPSCRSESTRHLSGIEKHPVELLDQILPDLPSSVKLLLRYTCRTLCLSSSIAIEDVFSDSPYERLLFLCMVERDGFWVKEETCL